MEEQKHYNAEYSLFLTTGVKLTVYRRESDSKSLIGLLKWAKKREPIIVQFDGEIYVSSEHIMFFEKVAEHALEEEEV